MKIVLWSAPGREDIVKGYYDFNKVMWPDCTFEIEPLLGETQTGWTKKTLEFLAKQTDDIIIYNGDDFFPFMGDSAKVDNQLVLDVEKVMRADPSIGSVVLDRNYQFKEEYKPFPRLKLYGKEQRLQHTCLGPIMARTSFMKAVGTDVLKMVPEKRDKGWGGMYNWELYGWHVAIQWNVLGTDNPIINRLNAVRQNKWMPDTVDVAKRFNINIDFDARGYYTGENPGVAQWEETRY